MVTNLSQLSYVFAYLLSQLCPTWLPANLVTDRSCWERLTLTIVDSRHLVLKSQVRSADRGAVCEAASFTSPCSTICIWEDLYWFIRTCNLDLCRFVQMCIGWWCLCQNISIHLHVNYEFVYVFIHVHSLCIVVCFLFVLLGGALTGKKNIVYGLAPNSVAGENCLHFSIFRHFSKFSEL